MTISKSEYIVHTHTHTHTHTHLFNSCTVNNPDKKLVLTKRLMLLLISWSAKALCTTVHVVYETSKCHKFVEILN